VFRCSLGLSLLAVSLAAGCHAKVEGNAQQPLKEVAQAPMWTNSTSRDPMTDVVTYSATVKNTEGAGSLTITCDGKNERLFVDSDLFLAAGQPLPILDRFGNEKADDYSAWAHEHTALVEIKLKVVKEGDIPDLDEFAKDVLFIQLRRANQPIRVRLQSFNGETRDLRFPVEGLHQAMREVEERCGIDKNGNYKPT
jgi:hypothetical protein